ncbi:hypothetical protein JTB14_019692 [Gonioctena quinquepunctata]|nr:hypothetical protein JTB14_019692 [Gonioctena quinquepunctata]
MPRKKTERKVGKHTPADMEQALQLIQGKQSEIAFTTLQRYVCKPRNAVPNMKIPLVPNYAIHKSHSEEDCDEVVYQDTDDDADWFEDVNVDNEIILTEECLQNPLLRQVEVDDHIVVVFPTEKQRVFHVAKIIPIKKRKTDRFDNISSPIRSTAATNVARRNRIQLFMAQNPLIMEYNILPMKSLPKKTIHITAISGAWNFELVRIILRKTMKKQSELKDTAKPVAMFMYLRSPNSFKPTVSLKKRVIFVRSLELSYGDGKYRIPVRNGFVFNA